MKFDCRKCGVCCVGLDVLLTDGEADEFESRPDRVRLTVLYPRTAAPPLRFMKRHAGSDRCVALAGPLGDCCCTIYAERPFLCRDLQAGSPSCLEARARTGPQFTLPADLPAPPARPNAS